MPTLRILWVGSLDVDVKGGWGNSGSIHSAGSWPCVEPPRYIAWQQTMMRWLIALRGSSFSKAIRGFGIWILLPQLQGCGVNINDRMTIGGVWDSGLKERWNNCCYWKPIARKMLFVNCTSLQLTFGLGRRKAGCSIVHSRETRNGHERLDQRWCYAIYLWGTADM